MKLFSNIRAKRSTAFVVLLVCLFAITSGLVNACVLEARGTHRHESATAHPFAEKAVAAISAFHTYVIASQGADSDTSRAPCLKVCEDGSQSVLKTPSRVDSADPVQPLLTGLVWTVAVPFTLALRPVGQAQPPEPGVPIRVRFARLTL